ncbi:MAG: hypothetical protein RIT14_1157 [Pseudomonadota bacterium]|jgi:hypothetical protein
MTNQERRQVIAVHNERCRVFINFAVGLAVAVIVAAGLEGTDAPLSGQADRAPLVLAVLIAMLMLLLAIQTAGGLKVDE